MTRLGWSPQTFWAATPADLLAAMEAIRLHGPTPMTSEELRAMRARFQE